jgi:glycosyltransferase involved in cell wall biosynthesis
MNPPRIAFLINGSSTSIEAVRAKGLARRLPPQNALFLARRATRLETWRQWDAEIRRWQPDALYVLNTGLPGVPLAMRWKARGVPFILDTGDAIEAMAKASGIRAGWRLPAIRLLEQTAHRNAAGVVVRGTRHKELLLASGLRHVVVIRDGFASQSEVHPEMVANVRRELGLEGRFVLGVMGSLVYSPKLKICYGWDLVDALAMLSDLPVIGFVIGDGNGRDWLTKRAERAGVAYRIQFRGRIPYERVPVELRLMDVAMSTQTNNIPGRVRTTGKVPEYMAAERYILASRVGEAELLLPESMLVEYQGAVDPMYPARIAEKVRRLFSQPDLLEERRKLPEIANRLCNYDNLSAEWLGALGLFLGGRLGSA